MNAKLSYPLASACLGALASGALACSSAPPTTMASTTGQCTSPPAACPTTMPSYQTDVAPILQRDCIPCHATNTGGKDETTWTLVSGQEEGIFVQVGNCLMPPTGSPQLTTADRTTLLDWLVCGAPDN